MLRVVFTVAEFRTGPVHSELWAGVDNWFDCSSSCFLEICDIMISVDKKLEIKYSLHLIAAGAKIKMFGFGEKKFVGIDIGTSSVKIVELKIIENKPVLTNYALVSSSGPITGGKDANVAYFETFLPEQLKKMVKEAKLDGRDAYVSIPAFGGLITLIEFPSMEKEDLDQAIRFEAHKYIPVPLEDIVLSWDVVSKRSSDNLPITKRDASDGSGQSATADKNERTQVLLVAAQKSQVAKYEKLAKNSGFNLKSVEIESFALVRSLVGNDQGNFIIVDIGSRVCNIMLIEKGVIKVNRNIDAGGKDITKIIARSMNVDEDRADKMKLSGKNFFDIESNVNFPIIDLIVKEISRVVRAHYGNDAEAPVDGIILSGGTAGFSGIEDYFAKKLKIRTAIGNPFGRVEYDKRLEPRIGSISNQFAVSIGLALGGINDYLKDKK